MGGATTQTGLAGQGGQTSRLDRMWLPDPRSGDERW